MSGNLDLLVILYFILLVVFAIHIIVRAENEDKLTCITLARMMYAIIYALVPLLVHGYVNQNGITSKDLMSLDYSTSGIKLFYCMIPFSIIGYIGLNVGYRYTFTLSNQSQRKVFNDKEKISHNDYSDKVLLISAFIMFFVGLFS